MFGDRVDADTDEVFVLAKAELEGFLAGEREIFDLPVRTQGDEFSERVWSMLREIPYGETTAIAAGFRPCGTCLPEKYAAWKQSREETR